MTDLHTAAKQALEALELEEAQTHYPPQWLLKAIAALRQALANSALDKMAENARELGLDYELQDKDPDLIEQPAQHEPFTHYRHYDNGLQDWADEKTIPLYTAPPAQRKPLTDEEIESINVRLAGNRDLARLFARAIEAAHGIKENT